MRATLVIVALVIGAAFATSSLAAGPKTFNFEFPLPPRGQGSIREIELKMQLPPGAVVQGTPFAFNLLNGAALLNYIRAAYAVVNRGSGTWDIVVAINRPKSFRSLSASTPTVNVSLQATPIGNGKLSADDPAKGDACHQLHYIRGWGGLATAARILLSGTIDSGKEIFDHTVAADPNCK